VRRGRVCPYSAVFRREEKNNRKNGFIFSEEILIQKNQTVNNSTGGFNLVNAKIQNPIKKKCNTPHYSYQ